MRIRTDNHVSCHSQTLFRKKRMFNSHFSHVKIVGNLVTTGKLSYTFAVFCGFNIFIRNKVVHNQCHFVFIKHGIHRHFIHFVNSHRYQIQICFNQLSCFYFIQSGMSCQNFLRHCHSHMFSTSCYFCYCHSIICIVIIEIHKKYVRHNFDL